MKKVLILTLLALASFVGRAYCTWDVSTPAGSEAKSLGDDRIREFKTDVQNTLQYEGDFPGSDTANPRFIYTPSTGTTALRPTGNARATGMLFINISSGCIEQYSGSDWACVGVLRSSVVTSAMLNVEVAGAGLGGGGGEALRVNVDSTTFSIVNDTITIKANGIASSMLPSSGTFTNLQTTNLRTSTQTWQGFGILPILQIQQYTTTTSSNTTNTGFTLTTLSGSFTPKLSTSKVIIFVQGVAVQNVGDGGYFTITRNRTNLAANTGGFTGTVSGNNYDIAMMTYDSPATASAVTYAVEFRTAGGGGSIVFPVSLGGVVPQATMIAVEIAQ